MSLGEVALMDQLAAITSVPPPPSPPVTGVRVILNPEPDTVTTTAATTEEQDLQQDGYYFLSYLAHKLRLEATSGKNLAALVAVGGIVLSFVGGNIHGALATELFAGVMAFYTGARAYVDGSGNGNTARALKAATYGNAIGKYE